MKKTPLLRRTPLSQKTALKSKGFVRKQPVKSDHSVKVTSSCVIEPPKPPARSKGLVGHGRTKDHMEIHSLISLTGCFACNYLNIEPKTRICVHHVRGRNNGKLGNVSEYLVIGLCCDHHNLGDASVPSVHGNKKLFTTMIGPETWCVHETYKIIGRRPPWLSECEWESYNQVAGRESQLQWVMRLESCNTGYSLALY